MTRAEAQQLGVWPCGHPRTPENTCPESCGSRCRTCKNQRARKSAAQRYRMLDDEKRRAIFERQRGYRVKAMIAATEHKLVMLRREADRRGIEL